MRRVSRSASITFDQSTSYKVGEDCYFFKVRGPPAAAARAPRR